MLLHYSMTRSARARSDCGMATPRALAVFRLITSSNVVGSSTGTSAGLEPVNILCTCLAACRWGARCVPASDSGPPIWTSDRKSSRNFRRRALIASPCCGRARLFTYPAGERSVRISSKSRLISGGGARHRVRKRVDYGEPTFFHISRSGSLRTNGASSWVSRVRAGRRRT